MLIQVSNTVYNCGGMIEHTDKISTTMRQTLLSYLLRWILKDAVDHTPSLFHSENTNNIPFATFLGPIFMLVEHISGRACTLN